MPRKISPEIWAGAKADFELGKLKDAEISTKYKINPSTLRKAAITQGWKRGILQSHLEETIAEKNTRLFAKHGITSDKIAKIMAATIDSEPAKMKDIAGIVDDLVRRVQATGRPDDAIRNELLNAVRSYGANRAIVLQYIQELNRMLGTHAPVKREITGKDGGPVLVTSTFKNMSDAELENLIKTYMKKFRAMQV